MSRFVGIVDKRQQVHLGAAGENTKEVVRANAVASVRRIREPVRQKQNSHSTTGVFDSSTAVR